MRTARLNGKEGAEERLRKPMKDRPANPSRIRDAGGQSPTGPGILNGKTQ